VNSAPRRTAANPATVAYTWLLDGIRRGVLTPGSRLPGERDLAVRIGVSRATLRRALTRLAEEGHLDASSQRGWFVRRQVVGEPASVLQSFTEMAQARGLRASARILQQRRRTASIDEAAQLRIAPSAPVLEMRRLRAMDDVPVCVDTTVLVGALVQPLVEADLTDRSLYQALRDDCGLVVARSSYTVQADVADAGTAKLLDLPLGAPVLVGQETTYDEHGTPILLGAAIYRGDAYRFEADLYRPLS
jgi:GntR family transcriptional regulator